MRRLKITSSGTRTQFKVSTADKILFEIMNSLRTLVTYGINRVIQELDVKAEP